MNRELESLILLFAATLAAERGSPGIVAEIAPGYGDSRGLGLVGAGLDLDRDQELFEAEQRVFR